MQNLPATKAIARLGRFGIALKFYELLAMQDSEDLLVTFIGAFDWVGDVFFLTNDALGDSFWFCG